MLTDWCRLHYVQDTMIKILYRGPGVQDCTQQIYAGQHGCHTLKMAGSPDPSGPNTSIIGTYL